MGRGVLISSFRPNIKKKWLAYPVANHFANPARAGAQTEVCATLRRLRRETTAAAAIAGRVGILEYKALAHQRLFVLECRPVQINQALRVHENPRAKCFENFVAVARLG